MKRPKGLKKSIFVVLLVLLVLSYYCYLSNKTKTSKDESEVKASPAQEVLMKDYDKKYPPTPKEVVKEYLQITKVLHNEKLTDEEVEAIAKKIQLLYDDEFIANKSEEDYIKDIKSEVATFRDNDYSITNYYTSSSTDVEEYSMDGYKFAKLYASYNVRAGREMKALELAMLLRKDENGHWKIYGWMPVTSEDNE